MPLSRQQILDADDRPFEDIEVPEWGGCVRLRVLNGAQRESIEIKMHQARSENVGTATAAWRGLKNQILAWAIVDESNQPVFTDKDVAALNAKNGYVIERLYAAVIKQNKFGKDEADELAKN